MYASTLGGTLAQARTPAELMKVDLIKQLYVKTHLNSLKDKQETDLYLRLNFLRRNFRVDLADVVDIDKTKIKEMGLNDGNKGHNSWEIR